MTKTTYENPLKYGYNPERSGAKYTLDGVHYMNSGEILEIIAKAHRGLKPTKEANTAFDMGSDIEQEALSIKSSKATLQTKYKADSFEQGLNLYFENTASVAVVWIVNIDEMITEYKMTMQEFKAFTKEWASLQRGYIRYKTSSGKMIKWLEERAR